MRLGLLPFVVLMMPIAEIAGFIVVGNAIGLWPTLGLIVASALLGALLLRHQGLGTLRRIQEETRAGRLPGREMVHGLMIALAGFLLILPGFISDVVGLLLFLPPVRDLAWKLLRGRVAVAAARPGGWRPGAGGWPASGPRRESGARSRPDVVDLTASDFERHADPASPWRANGHASAKPIAPPPGEGEDEAGPRTLH